MGFGHTGIKKVCKNPHHPFKQKWYWYEGGTGSIDSPDFCTSCMSYLNFLETLMTVSLMPQKTLYGDKRIKTDPRQLYEIAKIVEPRALEWANE